MSGSGGERAEAEAVLLQLAQKEYRQYGEIEELTREIVSAMDHDDQVSIRLLLQMRGNAMAELEKTRREQNTLLNSDNEWCRRIREIISGNDKKDMTETEKRICMLSKGKKEILKRTVELDRRISIRFAGDDSFYSR